MVILSHRCDNSPRITWLAPFPPPAHIPASAWQYCVAQFNCCAAIFVPYWLVQRVGDTSKREEPYDDRGLENQIRTATRQARSADAGRGDFRGQRAYRRPAGAGRGRG